MVNTYECERCNIRKSKYVIMTVSSDTFTRIEYRIFLCWKCGKFSISPDFVNDFTTSLLVNPLIILELIKLKRLKLV